MKEVKVVCQKCGNCMTYKNYWSWIWHTPIHWFNFFKWKDYRRIKCTKCGEISYAERELRNK